MASISGSNILNYDYLLRNCYSANRNVRKGGNRQSLAKSELLSVDSSALEKISKNLREISYDKENGKCIYNNAKGFIEIYNNTVGTAGKIVSGELERDMKKLKQFVTNHKDALEAVGIKITASGKMELDKDKMLKTSSEKMQKVLSGDFSVNMEKYAKKLGSVAKKLMKEEAARKNAMNQNLTMQTSSQDSAGTFMEPYSIDFRA